MDGLMVHYSFLLINGLVALILVMTLNDFESVFHHLDVILHLFELCSGSSRVALGIVLGFGLQSFCAFWLVSATFHFINLFIWHYTHGIHDKLTKTLFYTPIFPMKKRLYLAP